MPINQITTNDTIGLHVTRTSQLITAYNTLESRGALNVSVTAQTAFGVANSAFANGNANFIVLQTAFGVANDAYLQANTARNHANSAFVNSNANFIIIQSTSDVANASFSRANDATIIGSNAFSRANAAFAKANGAVQTGFTSVVANGNTISAATNTSSLTIFAGNNISITSNTGNNSLTISSTGSSFTSNVGNNTSNTFNIAHNLNTTAVIPAVKEISTGYYVYPDIKTTTPNNIELEFVNAPTSNQYSLLLLGLGV